jgi:hypothetical protein
LWLYESLKQELKKHGQDATSHEFQPFVQIGQLLGRRTLPQPRDLMYCLCVDKCA